MTIEVPVSGTMEWPLPPEIAAGLDRLGWRAGDPAADLVPAIAHGGNAVVVLPPAPAWADPVIAGLLHRPSGTDSGILILTAPALIGEWALGIGALAESTELRIDVERELGGISPLSGGPPPDVLIASPAGALERHARSALDPDRFRTIVFAWPEDWHADDAVSALLQDFPRDAQRVVLTADASQVDGPGSIVERYARKALIFPETGADSPAAGGGRIGSVRTVSTPWIARARSVAAVTAALDAVDVTIWTANDRDHQLIRRTAGSLRRGVALSSRRFPRTGAVICYDPPSARQLRCLLSVGDVVLLVPPGTEQHVSRIAPERQPMRLTSTGVIERDAALRLEIVHAMAAIEPAAAYYALAPLFEDCDPQSVACALFGLWRESTARTVVAAPVAAASPAVGAGGVAKIWIGAGKKDEATVGDFVGVLINEAGMERGQIGRIELRDTFALVEVPAADAEAIVQRLTGMTIRRRKLSARVDRGRGGGGANERPKR